MKPILTRAEARAMDRHAIDVLRIPSIVLMENAGRGAADAIGHRFAGSLGHVMVIGGTGQNGGDAWVVARHLMLVGARIIAIQFDADLRGASGDADAQLAIANNLGLQVHVARTIDATVIRALDEATLIIDGLFGTGLSRPIEGETADVIRAINASAAPVVSLDLPSGIDADTGAIMGVAIKANVTLTFGACKRGLLQGEGATNAGEVDVLTLGAPLADQPLAERIERQDVARHLSVRTRDAHKGTAGHVLVLAGSVGTTGAALLAARGAARAGAGLVTLAATPEARPEFERRVLEFMTREFRTSAELLALVDGKRAVVVGPGLGLDDASVDIVETLAFEAPVPVVLDADALTLVGRRGLERLRGAAARRVLTPHPGEAGVLLGVSAAEVQRDRHGAAKELAERSEQVIVLKGAGTIVTSVGEPDLVVDSGTPALGTGGSGDVLAGVIAAVVTQARAHRDAAIAAYWHALAGEHAALADRGLLASEVADALPSVLSALRVR